ncbi:efflux RND transporter periplasmic adaptor subunit [Pseudohalioglobus sediminis]|uniref:Efflux RND transporter periplasmic adaptor subunit n=1 Tax=Pseudohalioglobus sediminis TaxID=2606449 RepID=A0A5B0X389_9GAMM|nr:efflux RND transporter periplasmic adaptor subunit [Pseudohalioglobus sediminis]KAA1192761.1 efflux RND transporter periplasmic adaptor subunit [Pseudohalioglobus sediminis]
MASTLTKVIAPLLVIAASAGAYALLQASRPEPEKNDEPQHTAAVYTATVAPETEALEVITQGEVRSRTEIDLVAQVGGRVVDVSPEFVEGGRIQPGVPLLQIDDTDYQLALSEAKARLADAELAVQQALADQDVARKQLRNDPSPSDLALKKPQVAQAMAMREAARAGLEQARLELQRTRVTLPFAGRVADTRVHIGQFISPGAVLGTVFGTELVEVRLPLNNRQLASLGLPIGYTAPAGGGLPVTFSADVAGSNHQWTGKLVRLDASVDPDTRMLYAIAEVADPYGKAASKLGMPLAVGLFVEARIQGRKLDQGMRIPGSALRAGNIVYVVNREGLLEIRDVDVVHATADRAVISAGIAPGEQVVTSAIRNPIQGMAVRSLTSAEG